MKSTHVSISPIPSITPSPTNNIYHIMQFNQIPFGPFDPDTKIDGELQILVGQSRIWSLKDAFPNITPPEGIERVWGPYPSGNRIGIYFPDGRPRTNVSIEFGFVVDDSLRPGNWVSTIWTLGFRGWRIVPGPGGELTGTNWTTTPTITATGNRFEFEVVDGATTGVFTVSRIFFD